MIAPVVLDEDRVSRKRQLDRDRKDPSKTRIPELPLSGPGRGGRLGRSYQQFMVRDVMGTKNFRGMQ